MPEPGLTTTPVSPSLIPGINNSENVTRSSTSVNVHKAHSNSLFSTIRVTTKNKNPTIPGALANNLAEFIQRNAQDNTISSDKISDFYKQQNFNSNLALKQDNMESVCQTFASLGGEIEGRNVRLLAASFDSSITEAAKKASDSGIEFRRCRASLPDASALHITNHVKNNGSSDIKLYIADVNKTNVDGIDSNSPLPESGTQSVGIDTSNISFSKDVRDVAHLDTAQPLTSNSNKDQNALDVNSLNSGNASKNLLTLAQNDIEKTSEPGQNDNATNMPLSNNDVKDDAGHLGPVQPLAPHEHQNVNALEVNSLNSVNTTKINTKELSVQTLPLEKDKTQTGIEETPVPHDMVGQDGIKKTSDLQDLDTVSHVAENNLGDEPSIRLNESKPVSSYEQDENLQTRAQTNITGMSDLQEIAQKHTHRISDNTLLAIVGLATAVTGALIDVLGTTLRGESSSGDTETADQLDNVPADLQSEINTLNDDISLDNQISEQLSNFASQCENSATQLTEAANWLDSVSDQACSAIEQKVYDLAFAEAQADAFTDPNNEQMTTDAYGNLVATGQLTAAATEACEAEATQMAQQAEEMARSALNSTVDLINEKAGDISKLSARAENTSNAVSGISQSTQTVVDKLGDVKQSVENYISQQTTNVTQTGISDSQFIGMESLGSIVAGLSIPIFTKLLFNIHHNKLAEKQRKELSAVADNPANDMREVNPGTSANSGVRITEIQGTSPVQVGSSSEIDNLSYTSSLDDDTRSSRSTNSATRRDSI